MPFGSSEDSLLLDLPAARPVGGGIHYIFTAAMRHSTRLHSQLRGRFGGCSSPRCLLGTTRPRFALLARSDGLSFVDEKGAYIIHKVRYG
ncbi:hypothetical protein AB4090_14115 [Acidithiobacillus sp. IBUN Pt1247-S3]|uniref:hypothetical protein n=1 Tax=Acidithiobacillus sp. IBUN Pt1247-S3 TaxID=3166642 RepID=UPI0034E43470